MPARVATGEFVPEYPFEGTVNSREPFYGLPRLTLTDPSREDVMNNSSMFTADRMTHLKIVVVSLVCATMVAGIGVAARMTDSSIANSRLEATVIKATTTPVTATIETPTIR